MIRIGGDPEYFTSIRFNTLPEGFEKDGVAVEYHIRPTEDVEEYINQLMIAREIIGAENKQLITINPQELSEEERRLGCDASYNIYRDRGIPMDAETYKYRTAGGHIHMSKEVDGERQYIDPQIVIRALDRTLGLWSVITAPDKEAEKKRRVVYGRAGEYRMKNLILEYRTLSNFWTHNPEYIKLVFGVVKEILEKEELASKIAFSVDDITVQKAINDVDEELALELLSTVQEVYNAHNFAN